MATLIWTSEAERWLKEIFDFIAEDDPQAAANVVAGIYDKAQVLLSHPEIGYKYEHESEEEIRILFVWPLSNYIPHKAR